MRKEGRLHRVWYRTKEKRTKQDGQTHLSLHPKDSLQCSNTPLSCSAYMKAVCAEKEVTQQIQDGTQWSWPLALLGKWKLKCVDNFPAAVCSGDREDLVYSEDILPNQTFHNSLVLYKHQCAQQLPGTLLWRWLCSLHCLKAAMSGLLLLAFDPPLKTQHDWSHPPHHLSFTWLSGTICLNHALSPWFGLFQPFSLKHLLFLQPLSADVTSEKVSVLSCFPTPFMNRYVVPSCSCQDLYRTLKPTVSLTWWKEGHYPQPNSPS